MPSGIGPSNRSRASPARGRLWREWCFARVLCRHFGIRFALIAALLVAGALLFRVCEPERRHTVVGGAFYTWSLIFGNPPEDFPRAPALQVAFFVVPVLGLLIILETLVEFGLLLRDRRRNERSWCTTMAAALSDHVVLVGLGKLGIRTFRLLRELGAAVVVIERDPANQFLDEVRRSGAPLLIGDARNDALLEEANVRAARSIVLATDNDLVNLEAALDARRFHPGVHVVMRMFDQAMADKIRQAFDIRGAMSQSSMSAPAFAVAALQGSIVSSQMLDGQLLVMRRWTVRAGDPLCDCTVGEAMAEHCVGIVQRHAAGGPVAMFPPPATRLAPGDELIVQGTLETLAALPDPEAPRGSAAAVRR